MRERIVIIGNSGSGKSHLARELGAVTGAKLTHLDALFWVPGGFNQKRPADEVEADIAESLRVGTWIVEGVFGELATRFLPQADLLIWLDLPWQVCRSSLLARGSESAKQLQPEQAEESFKRLIHWASEYWTRTDLRSYSGHSMLFREFGREKIKFADRRAVDQYVAEYKRLNMSLEGNCSGRSR
jgi:adenylate kinase family enzyme